MNNAKKRESLHLIKNIILLKFIRIRRFKFNTYWGQKLTRLRLGLNWTLGQLWFISWPKYNVHGGLVADHLYCTWPSKRNNLWDMKERRALIVH